MALGLDFALSGSLPWLLKYHLILHFSFYFGSSTYQLHIYLSIRNH